MSARKLETTPAMVADALAAFTPMELAMTMEAWLIKDAAAAHELLPLVQALAKAAGSHARFPVADVLDILADAADHLLRDHDCDNHGHEQVATARDVARASAQELRAAMASTVPWLVP